jgi:hypothetical protein
MVLFTFLKHSSSTENEKNQRYLVCERGGFGGLNILDSFSSSSSCLNLLVTNFYDKQGDSKLTTKGGDGSVKKDALGHGGATSSAPQGVSIFCFIFVLTILPYWGTKLFFVLFRWASKEHTTKEWVICSLR